MNYRLFGLVASCSLLAGAAAADEPAKVTVVQPVERTVTDAEDFTGRTVAAATVDLKPRVTGYLLKVHFKAGSTVKKGDLLFEIDARPYQAERDRAQAELAKAQAELKLAQTELERLKKLKDDKLVSPQDLDKAAGAVAGAEASVAVARAVLELAKLNLSYTRVTAPIDGKISRPLLDPGNLVKADDTVLATIVQEEPAGVSFDMDERTLLRFRKALRAGDLKEPATVLMALADEKDFRRRGEVAFTDSAVDPSNGTIRVHAVFPDAGKDVVPGMFVRVRLLLGPPRKALLIPNESARSSGGRKFVFVVNDKNVVEERPVKRGAVFSGMCEVKEGLKAGEWVIVSKPLGVDSGDLVKPERTKPEEDKKP